MAAAWAAAWAAARAEQNAELERALGELAPKGDWCGRDALTSGFVERAIVVLESEQHD
jgi:hypothetical protein